MVYPDRTVVSPDMEDERCVHATIKGDMLGNGFEENRYRTVKETNRYDAIVSRDFCPVGGRLPSLRLHVQKTNGSLTRRWLPVDPRPSVGCSDLGHTVRLGVEKELQLIRSEPFERSVHDRGSQRQDLASRHFGLSRP